MKRILLTVGVMVFSLYLYFNLSNWGLAARTNENMARLCMFGWLWLFIIQFVVLANVWSGYEKR